MGACSAPAAFSPPDVALRGTETSPNKSPSRLAVDEVEGDCERREKLAFLSLYLCQKGFCLSLKCLQIAYIKEGHGYILEMVKVEVYLFPVLNFFLLCPLLHIFYPFS